MEKSNRTDIKRFYPITKRALYLRMFLGAFLAILIIESVILFVTYILYFDTAETISKETMWLFGLGCVISTVIALIFIWVIELAVAIRASQAPIKSDEEFALLLDLDKAIKNLELVIYFQPIINLLTNKIIGMEALLRWEHPKFGKIMPDYFIPLAEKAGIIEPISEWTILQACSYNKRLLDSGHNLKVAVNISPIEFKNPLFVDTIMKILILTELPAQNLELEITESSMIDNMEFAIKTMQTLRNMGVSLSLDDFGTGYSSLAHVDRLPIQKIKIDKAFVHKLGRKTADSSIAHSIIQMAKKLNLSIIVEGIENEYQRKYFSELHCQEGQGFYLGAPVPAPKFIKYLTPGNID